MSSRVEVSGIVSTPREISDLMGEVRNLVNQSTADAALASESATAAAASATAAANSAATILPTDTNLNSAGRAADSKATGDAIRSLMGAIGTPLIAATVADMTDQTKIYVYTGSETGYTAGNWYYYNGSAWVSGGVYNSTAFETDTTLSHAGEAADAKKTGELIAPVYSSAYTYDVGDYVNYNGTIYRCTTAITTAEAWTPGHWTATNAGSELTDLKSALKPVGKCTVGTFNVAAGTTHEFYNDIIPVSFDAGTPFYVFVSGVAKYQIYVYYSENNYARVAFDTPYFGTLENDIIAVGVYILGTTITESATVTVKAFEADSLFGAVGANTIGVKNLNKKTASIEEYYINSFDVAAGTTHEFYNDTMPVNIAAGTTFYAYVTGALKYQIYVYYSENEYERVSFDTPYYGALENDVIAVGVYILGSEISYNSTVKVRAFAEDTLYGWVASIDSRLEEIEEMVKPLGYWYGNGFSVTTGTTHDYTSNVLPVKIPSGQEFSVYVSGNARYHIFAIYSDTTTAKIATDEPFAGSVANDVTGIGVYILGDWISANKTITTEVFTNDSVYKRLKDLEIQGSSVENDITQINNQIDELNAETETNTGEIVDSNIYGSDKGYAAYFSDGATDHKLLGLRCDLPYSSSGRGSATIRQITGKNLIAPLGSSQTINDVTFTVNSDGTIATSGTATAYTTFYIANRIPFKGGVTYELSGCPSGGSETTYRMSLAGLYTKDYGTGGIFIPECDINSDVRIQVNAGTDMDGLVFKPMVRYAYQPEKEYGENIININGKNQTINGVSFVVNPDGTIFVNGTATAYTTFYVQTGLTLTGGETYHLSGNPIGGSANTFRMAIGGIYTIDTGSGNVYTPESDVTTDIRIMINSGTAMDRRVFIPKLSVISKPPVEDFENANVITKAIGFPTIIYGGFVDVLNGKVTSTLAQDGSALATPVTYNTTNVDPITFTVSEGDNTFFTSNACPLEVKYLKDQKIVSERAKNIDFLETYKKYKDTFISSALTVGIPILYLVGDTTAMTKDIEADLDWVFNDKCGRCTLKWQGSSSLQYSKKNYTIKFKDKVDFGKGWGAQKKYNLKANYIDFSHARNVVSGKLWGKIVKSRSTQNPYLYNLPNGGAVDGFPVIVTINDEYHGLFTMNIPKDKWMFGMTGSEEYEGILGAETHSLPTQFKATITETDLINENAFSVEYAPDEDNIGWMATSVSQAITAVMNADSVEDASTIEQYLDLDSAIDHYIFACLIGATDCTDKNFLLATFDGTKWYMSEWDMDTTYGNSWTGGSYVSAKTEPTFMSYASLSTLMNYIYTYKRNELKARYNALRADIMSVNNVAMEIYNFSASIPKVIKDIDMRKYPLLPATDTNTVDQIVNWYRMRCEVLDAEINALT